MSWWSRLWRGAAEPSPEKRRRPVRLTLQGWTEEAPNRGVRVWRDSEGDVLSLAVQDSSLGLPELSDEVALQRWSRHVAERRGGGLIEVCVGHESYGPTVGLIYKRLEKPAYIFTGMLLIPSQEGSQVWTVVAGEHGTTGVREAVVTTELLDAGRLTIEDYKRSWAQDPYDAAYGRVDGCVLRFVSDDEGYDERFPQHPLSKVRRVLATLPGSVRVESGTPEA